MGLVEQFACEQGFSVGLSMGCTHLCLEQVVQQRGGAALRATLPAPDSKVQGAAREAVCRSSGAGDAGAEEADTRACSLGFARGVLEFWQGQDGFAVGGLAVDRWLADSAQIDTCVCVWRVRWAVCLLASCRRFRITGTVKSDDGDEI